MTVLLCQIVLMAGPMPVAGDEVAILTEQLDQRTANTKTFLLSDGGYTAVHYETADGWESIDNSLETVTYRQNAGGSMSDASLLDRAGAAVGLVQTKTYYTNRNNSFKVSLPQTMTADSPVMVQQDNHLLGFALTGQTVSAAADYVTADAEVQHQAQLQQKLAAAIPEEQAQLTFDEGLRHPHASSTLQYAEVLPDMDVSYTLSGQSLKESIIFNTVPTQSAYTYQLQYTNLTPALQEDGAVNFYAPDAGEDDEPVFVIQAPYMFDGTDASTTAVAVTLTPTATGCLYTLQPDMAWLQDAARVYPVTLDPTVYTSRESADIEDNGVNEYNPTTNYYTTNRMYVGSNYANGRGYESRAYVRFKNLPQINATDYYIRYAGLDLTHYAVADYQSADNNQYEIYKVGNYNWNSQTITWNTQKNYVFSGTPVRFTSDKDDADGKERVVITDFVRSWYTGSANNGIVIKPRTVDNTKTNRTCYVSSDIGVDNINARPVIVIDYYVGSPTAGITSGQKYYIRNVSSGMYLKADNTPLAQLYQSFHSTSVDNYLRWIVVYLGGGVYSFVYDKDNDGTVNDAEDLYMGISSSQDEEGRKVEVYTPTYSRGQTFRIIRNEEKYYQTLPEDVSNIHPDKAYLYESIFDNSYSIQPLCSDTRYVSLSVGGRRQESVTINLRGKEEDSHTWRWIFTQSIPSKKAKCFGGLFYLDPVDWAGELKHAEVRMAARGLNVMGYNARPFTYVDKEHFYNAAVGEDVLVFSCHGGWNSLQYVGDNVSTDFDIVPYATGQGNEITFSEMGINNVDLIIFLACNTAQRVDEGKNICDIATDDIQSNGLPFAKCAIGWEQTTSASEDEVEWLRRFMWLMRQGKTVAQALEELNDTYSSYTYLREARAFGNDQITLYNE